MAFIEYLASLVKKGATFVLKPVATLGVRIGSSDYCAKKVSNSGSVKVISTSTLTSTGSGVLHRVIPLGAYVLTIKVDNGSNIVFPAFSSGVPVELGIEFTESLEMKSTTADLVAVYDGNNFE